jgi:hypothetical protein
MKLNVQARQPASWCPNFSIPLWALVVVLQPVPELPSALECDFPVAYCFGLARGPAQTHPSQSLKKKAR